MQKAVSMLLGMDNIGIIVHRNPDGDCLGSAYALAAGLKQIGKKAKVVCADKLTRNLSEVYGKITFEDFSIQNYISVDTATAQQMGQNESFAAVTKLAIDHHPTNSHYAEYSYVAPSAAATCEIIYELLFELGCTITREIATYLYIGIITDTGCFQFSNTTPTTHIIAADLICHGVDAYELNRIFFSTKSRARVQIEREVLQNLEFMLDDKVAIIPITIESREKAHADDGDIDGISPIAREIEGVEIGITAREQGYNTWRVSVRTNTYVDASKICQEFGGGGHARASGCTVTGTYDEVKAKFREVCKKYL